MNGKIVKNPIIAYWKALKNGKEKYLQVTVDNEVLKGIFSGAPTSKLSVFFNTEKKSEKTPDIVVKQSTAGAGSGSKSTTTKYPF